MAIRSGFFNSVNGDRKYDARRFAEYFNSFIGNGVFPNPSTNLQVITNNDMTVIVKVGKAWINGYILVNDDDYILEIDPADGVLNRTDRIVARYDVADRGITLEVKKGTFASEPTAPTLQRDADAYELALADIAVNKGAISITQANITDLRLNKELCGIVHGVVDQVDPTAIFNQFQSWYSQTKDNYNNDIAKWTEEKKQTFDTWYAQNTAAFLEQFNTWYDNNTADWSNDFKTWFDNIKGQLDGDLGVRLTQEVNALQNNKIDKVEGKQLSTEDYTTKEKGKLEGIEEGAEKNKVTSVNGKTGKVVLNAADIGAETPAGAQKKANTAETNAKNYADSIKPIKVSQLANDTGFITTQRAVSSSVTSTSSTTAASSKAVKTAMDKAKEAFQSASDGKQQIATAITGKGVPTSSSDTFKQLANSIRNIEVGDYKIGDYIPVEKTDYGKPLLSWSLEEHSEYASSALAIVVDNSGNVYCGGYDKKVRKISPDGNEIWSFGGNNGSVMAVAVDDSGNIYSGSLDNTVRKISPDGNEIWSFGGNNDVLAITVDDSGNIYSGDRDGKVRKISPDGNEIWSFGGNNGSVMAVAVDDSGNIYITDRVLRKISPDGNEIWSFGGNNGSVMAVAVDDSGNIYITDRVLRKISPDGNEIWSFSTSGSLKKFALDNKGNIYAYSNYVAYKVSPNGSEIWSFGGEGGIDAIAVDNNGNVYRSTCCNDYNEIQKILTNIKIIG